MRTPAPLVDCDIHNELSPGALTPYLPARWRAYDETYGRRGDGGANYPKGSPAAARTDAWPPSGLPPGGDLDFMRAQHLDPLDIRYGILNCLTRANRQQNPDHAAALCTAVNEWQVHEWLEKEPRLRAGITVPYEDPQLAVAEIDRAAAHPGFVQVLLLVRTDEPLGRRKYRPILEAAARHGLPVGIHFGGGRGRNPVTAAGWPSFYIEDHTAMAQAFQAQVVSLVLEGVFEQLPTLRVVLIEGGFGWLPSLVWRMDKHWARLRAEVPHLTRRPSEYVRDHIWLTTQPIEEPPEPADLLAVFDDIGVSKIMFSTDYPHWDFDAPDRAIQARLPPTTRAQIFGGNAMALYGLG